MAYSLDPAKPVSVGLREAALGEIDGAIRWLSPPSDFHQGIHNARKCLKRLRSLLRLAKAGLPAPLYDHLEDSLKSIARELAPARDARALADTLGKLGKKAPKLAQSDAATGLKAWLQDRAASAEFQMQEDIRRRAVEALQALRPRFARLAVFPDDFSPLAKGLKSTYRACRKAYRLALADKSDEAFHDWRKEVQRHWRQMQLVTPAWPEALKPRAEHVHALAQTLGDDHDMANLRSVLLTPAMSYGTSHDREKLAKRCRKQQNALRAEAKRLGQRLFAEKPKHFAARIAAKWQTMAELASRQPEPQIPDDPAEPETRRQDQTEDTNIVQFGAQRIVEWRLG